MKILEDPESISHRGRCHLLLAPDDFVINPELKAIKQGIIRKKGALVSVEPKHTRYMPRPGDLVIGFIEGCTNNIWFIELGAPFNAILPMSLGPG